MSTAAPMTDLVPLSLLRAGQAALIETVMGAADQVHRLHEMGLRDGVRVEMVQPGTTCIVRLNGQKVCFRFGQATHVLVRDPMAADCSAA